ncbi:MAG: hypothetical protein R3C31_10230 [Hyphomonadaceae bacterium]
MAALDCMVDADICDDALIQGLKGFKDTMAARLHRLEEREVLSSHHRAGADVAAMRALSAQAPTIISQSEPSLVVDEEAQVPAQYRSEPVPNKRRAKRGAPAGEEIGAHLSVVRSP